jgi:predicted MFS family arabinose efflux permease
MPEMGDSRVRERVILLVLASVQFTNIVDFMVVMPLGPKIIEGLRLTPWQFSLVLASYTYSASLAGLFASFFVDRFDRKTTFLSLYGGFLLGNVFCAWAPNYHALLGARVFTGAFGGILGGLALTIVGDVFPESRRGAATGTLMSAFSVASVVGVPFGLLLGNRYGWNAPFVFLVALGSLVLVLGIRALPSIREHLSHEPAGHALHELGITLTHSNHLRAFALVVTIMVGGFAVISAAGNYFVFNVKVSEANLPIVYVVGGALTFVAAPVVGRLADRFGKLAIYRVFAPIVMVLMLVLSNLPRVPLAAATAVFALLMVGNAGRMVAALTMVISCVEPRRRGRFMSVNSSVQHFSMGFGSNLAGYMLGRAADGTLVGYSRVGLLAAAITGLSIVLAGRLRPAAQGDIPADPAELADDAIAGEAVAAGV